MSWWLFKKEKDGKWRTWLIDINPILLLFLLGLVVVLVAPNFVDS